MAVLLTIVSVSGLMAETPLCSVDRDGLIRVDSFKLSVVQRDLANLSARLAIPNEGESSKSEKGSVRCSLESRAGGGGALNLKFFSEKPVPTSDLSLCA